MTARDPIGTTARDMYERAQVRGTKVDTYNPHQLIRDVMELLAAKGLHPELPREIEGRFPLADAGAHQLLRALGILPAARPEDLTGRMDHADREALADREACADQDR